jgi:hypothetical protein
MVDTKTTVFTMDGEVLGFFNLSEEQIRLLKWLRSNNVFDEYFEYEISDSVEDM